MAQPTTTDLPRLVDEGPATPSLPQYQKLLSTAVVLMPLQRAFTVDVGFPFKPAEVLIFLAAASCVMAGVRTDQARRAARRRPPRPGGRLVHPALAPTGALVEDVREVEPAGYGLIAWLVLHHGWADSIV